MPSLNPICLNLWYLKVYPASWERQEMGKYFLRNHVPESFMPFISLNHYGSTSKWYFISLDL